LNLFRPSITAFYTTDEGTYKELYMMFIWEGVCCIFVSSNAAFSTILRIIGKTKEYSMLMIINQVVLWDTLSVLFLFWFGWSGSSVV